eukprot:s391_g18.t1
MPPAAESGAGVGWEDCIIRELQKQAEVTPPSAALAQLGGVHSTNRTNPATSHQQLRKSQRKSQVFSGPGLPKTRAMGAVCAQAGLPGAEALENHCVCQDASSSCPTVGRSTGTAKQLGINLTPKDPGEEEVKTVDHGEPLTSPSGAQVSPENSANVEENEEPKDLNLLKDLDNDMNVDGLRKVAASSSVASDKSVSDVGSSPGTASATSSAGLSQSSRTKPKAKKKSNAAKTTTLSKESKDSKGSKESKESKEPEESAKAILIFDDGSGTQKTFTITCKPPGFAVRFPAMTVSRVTGPPASDYGIQEGWKLVKWGSSADALHAMDSGQEKGELRQSYVSLIQGLTRDRGLRTSQNSSVAHEEVKLPAAMLGGDAAAIFFSARIPIPGKWAYDLEVNVLSAQNLRDADWGGKSDPYCVVSSPVWNHMERVTDMHDGDQLFFEIFDHDHVGKDARLGYTSVGWEELQDDSGVLKETLVLEESGKKDKDPATLNVKITVLKRKLEMSSGTASMGLEKCYRLYAGNSGSHDSRLGGHWRIQTSIFRFCLSDRVDLKSARGLRDADSFFGGGGSDPYCVCTIVGSGKAKFKTRALDNKTDPVWNESCAFVVEELYREFLEILHYWQIIAVPCSLVDEMAAPGTSGNLPLQEFRREIPPGWSPGDTSYPLKLYMEKLQLWYKTTTLEDEVVGPMVAGRLHGRAAKVAMSLRVPRPDGSYDVGPEALSRLSVDEVVDPASGQVIQQPIASGVQYLITALRQTFGQQDQDLATNALDKFFSLSRTSQKMTLAEYSVEFDVRYDEAHDRAGLQLNDVGKFYIWFKHSGLAPKTVDDIKLQVGGDYTRFQDARSLALRMSPNHPSSEADIFYEDWADDIHYDGDYDDDAWWYGYGGYEDDETYWDDYDQYYDDYEDGHYYWDDEYGWLENQPDGEQEDAAADGEPSQQQEGQPLAEPQGDFYKGKSKGKGGDDGCFNCGSKWHMAKDCPLQAQRHGDQRGKGKGYGKPFGMRKGKSKGKGKSWGWRPSFKGKGKGRFKGFGKSPYGRKGFGKRHWFATPKPTLDFSAGIPDASTRKLTSSATTSSQMTTTDNTKVEKFTMYTSSEEEDFTWLKRSSRSSKSPDNAEAATPILEKKHGTAFSFAVFHADHHAKETESYFTVRGEQRHGLLIDPGAASGLIGSETLRELMSRCVTPLGKHDEVVMNHNKTTPVSGISGGSDHTLGEVTLPLQAGGQNITFTAEVIGGDGSMCPALVGNPTLRKMDASIFSNWFANGDGLLMVGGRNAEENSKEYRLFRLLLTESGHYILPTDYESSGKVARETRKEIILFSQRVAEESSQRWNDVHTRVRHCFMSKNDMAEQTEGDRGERHVSFAVNNNDKPDAVTVETFHSEEHDNLPKNTASKNVDMLDYDLSEDPDVSKINDKSSDQNKEPYMNDESMTDQVSPEHAILAEKSPKELADAKPHDIMHDDTFCTELDQADNTDNKDSTAILASTKLDDEEFPIYTGDQLPEGSDVPKLTKRYKAMPEEFYSKTGLRPVTPKNFKRWFQRTRGKGLRWHAWELFSGTGRLSLILMMAGLVIGFPVDLRYGWDLGNAEHQAMLRQAQKEFKPGVVHMAPDCAPWSVASSSKEPDERLAERHAARPSLEFTQEVCENQSRHQRGYNVEQPYGSAMFQEDLPENPLHLADLPDHRKRQRIDQCMHGAEDECKHPIQKATGFNSNIKWSKTALRCSGHKGRQHAHLRGTGPNGLSRTSTAAAYPRGMCQKMRLDILGRACPPDIPHTMVPKECRHGRWAEGSGPKATTKSGLPAQDPISTWKIRTNKENLDKININDHIDPLLSDQQKHYLKKVLTEMIHNVLDFFKESNDKKVGEGYWLDNQLHLAIFKEIFQGHMLVRGVRVELRPFNKHDAQPQLAFESSHLRLAIHGDIKEWHVGPLEDLRECSHNQINEYIAEDLDWLINIFGTELQGVPAPSTPARRPRAIPAESSLPPKSDGPLKQPAVLALPDQETGEDALLKSSAYEPAEEGPQEEEEFEAKSHRDLAPIRPNYNLRRVLQRLPVLVEKGDNEKAKRLLLGLHERLWHSPASDFTSLLRRSGMSGEVINLAREAVGCCAICRKYVRLPNRPQMRARGANVFNQTVQMDLYYWESTWFMLLVDEATRFKKCGTIEGQEAEQLLQAFLELWVYHFGPPERLVLDQQVSLMSHDAGSEFERLGINRCPRGTTAGAGAEQHTGTGIAERHVQLVKLTMFKIRAELQRQGLHPTESELAQEAAMSHNLTLSYGGVTPAMAVYGTLPREFHNPESEHVLNTTGALDTDLTVFERAMRIRQTALAQAQQAVIEDRVARAARTRPHQLEVDSLVAGTSEVEFYREVKKDPGWRGPALLLRLDADEGVAVIQYQGKPYLVSLRHIRPFKGIYHMEVQSPQLEDSLRKLMKYVENMTEYKIYLYGWIKKKNESWIKLPKNNHEATDVLEKAITVSKGMTRRELHGVLFGRALRSMKPPAGTNGVLITWLNGSRNYAVQEHKSDNHLQMKKISNFQREDLCVLYFFYYHGPLDDTSTTSLKPSTLPTQKPTSTSNIPEDDAPQPMDEDPANRKREGPETRTVVLSPEKKKQKMAYIQKDLEFLRHWYLAHSPSAQVQLDFSDDWRHGYNLMTNLTRNFLFQKYEQDRKKLDMLFCIEYKSNHEVLACIRTAHIYKVDEETNTFEDHEITPEMWPQVDEADSNEIKQFVDEKALKPIHRLQITDEMVTIDCKWVRKKKRYPDRSIRIKSRLCARGCFDSQKSQLTTRSTTATRLSQRILVSQAARTKKTKKSRLESWDIAGAFLKGFDFKKIQESLRKLGVSAPTRQVVVFPPWNVWRHLQRHSDLFKVPQHSLHEWGLLCLKPIYGLNDAPLAWQMCLHAYVTELGGVRSHLDENCFYWKSSTTTSSPMSLDNVTAMVTTHVDDLALTASQDWLDHHYNLFQGKFKKVTRQKLPFAHCGCNYADTPTGFSIDQIEFVEKMKPAPVPARPDDSKLLPNEISDFRSILGALLWITATRLDIIADVSVLQSRVTTATVKEIKLANEVLVKAKQHKEAMLHYRQFESDKYRLVCVHDASAANNGRHYAQEGILIFLMDDAWFGTNIDSEVEYDATTVLQHGGTAHLLHAHGGKAKRVSYSTSHAETLSMVNGMESTTLILIRLSEMMHTSVSPTIKELIVIQESGNPLLPCDFVMDCKDLWELCTGQKVLPQDKTQRLYILGVRESRVTGKIRMTILVPTESMVADALTKPMISPGLLQLLTTGRIEIFGTDGHPVLSRVLPSLQDYDEQTLMKSDDEILQMAKDEPYNVRVTVASILFGAVATAPSSLMRTAMLLGMATMATAHNTEEIATENTTSYGYNFIGLSMHYGITFIIVIAAIMVEKYINKLSFTHLLWHYFLVFVSKLSSKKVKIEDDPMDVDVVGQMGDLYMQNMADYQEQIQNLTEEKDRLTEYTRTMEINRNNYKQEAEDANFKLATAEDQIDDLQQENDRKQAFIDAKTQELNTALQQKNYNAQRLTQLAATLREKDARIADLKEQLQSAGNKMARQDDPGFGAGSLPSSSARPERQGELGLHRIDMRAMRDELENANDQIRQLTEEVKEKKEAIENMRRVHQQLQERLIAARYPPEIRVTSGGTRYHVLGDFHRGDKLLFEIYDKDIGKKDDFLGKCEVSSQKVLAGFDSELKLQETGMVNKKPVEAFVSVAVKAQKRNAQGLAPFHSRRGLANHGSVKYELEVQILSADGLRNADWLSSGSDPYCLVTVKGKGKSSIRTKTMKNEHNPLWRHTDKIEDFYHGDKLAISVRDADRLKHDDMLGHVQLETEQLIPDGFEGDLKLRNTGWKDPENHPVFVTMVIKVISRQKALAVESEKCRALELQNAELQEEISQLVETQKTLEATSAIKLEGLQEKYNELHAQGSLQVSSDQAERLMHTHLCLVG